MPEGATGVNARGRRRGWLALYCTGVAVLLFGIAAGLAIRESGPPAVTTAWNQPDSVSGLVYDGTSLWVTLDGKPTIQQVDPDTGTVLGSFPYATPDTGGSAWDGRWLYQIAYVDRTIHKIDLASGRIVGRMDTPGPGMCAGMTYDGRHLWVANFDDSHIYAIDPEDGRIVRRIRGNFETTGLAWDGRFLWTGILVGTKSHDEVTPYTGFLQQKDVATEQMVSAVPLPGVGPGTSDWLPGQRDSRRFWWYDGYNRRIALVSLPRRGAGTWPLAAGGLVLLMGLASLLPMPLSRRAVAPAAPALAAPDAGGRS